MSEQPMERAKQLIDRCKAEGVRLCYPIQNDAVTVMAIAAEMFVVC